MFGPGTLDLGHKRRSIYFFVKRSQLIPTMILFDAPDTLLGIEQRVSTTIAPQGPFADEQRDRAWLRRTLR